MARDNDDQSVDDNKLSDDFDNKPPGSKQRREPTFSHYDEDEEYEEPDRDADYTSGYHVDGVDHEEDIGEDYPEEDEPDLFRDEDSDSEYDANLSDEDEPDTWAEKEAYFEAGEERQQSWPMSLIAVAIIALVLLAAGGYGVMKQRTATENEMRELRAALATTTSPGDINAIREALEELQQSFDKLALEAEALSLENQTLSDTVAGLQAQLGEQQAAPVAKVSAAKKAKPKPVQPVATQSAATAPKVTQTAPKTKKAKPTVTTSSGPWFVNFGSYAMRNVAESWAVRLQPGAGKVKVIPTTSDGRTLYRLRVIGLADKAAAKQVAHKLETDLQVSELWVGKE